MTAEFTETKLPVLGWRALDIRQIRVGDVLEWDCTIHNGHKEQVTEAHEFGIRVGEQGTWREQDWLNNDCIKVRRVQPPSYNDRTELPPTNNQKL